MTRRKAGADDLVAELAIQRIRSAKSGDRTTLRGFLNAYQARNFDLCWRYAVSDFDVSPDIHRWMRLARAPLPAFTREARSNGEPFTAPSYEPWDDDHDE